MLYLHVLLETGILGLGLYLLLGWALLRALWESGDLGRSLGLATMGLLVAAWTQETFYPVPATGSFLGLYLALCGLVAAQAGPKAAPRAKGSASTFGKEGPPLNPRRHRESAYAPTR